MKSEHVIIERVGNDLSITLNRPDQANALSSQIVESVIEAITDAQRDGQICSAIVRGNGRHFCAGFDLSDLESLGDGDLLWRFLRIETMLQAVHHAPFPVMALAHGQVIGAGADLFAACWHRVAAPDSKFQMPGWNFELALGTRRLTALVGRDAARDLLIDATRIDANAAAGINLASAVSAADHWPQLVDQFQERAKALPRNAVRALFGLTANDTRDADIAAIVATAGRPGLKQRIVAYRDKVARERAARRAG